MDKKHIVIDARESGSSTGRYIDNLLPHLHALQPKYDITVLTKSHRAALLRPQLPNFTVLDSNAKEFTFAEQLSLLRQLIGLKPDLVHFGKDHQPILYPGKSVTTMHDLTTLRFRNPAKHWLVFSLKRIIYGFVVWLVAHKSKRIIVPTEFVRKDVAHYCHVPLEKIVVTYEAAEAIADTSEPYTSLVGARYIMYTGRPTPHKNLDRLIDAFAKLKETEPNLQLVLVGKKDANYLRHQRTVEERGLKGVVFTDFVPDSQLRWLFENCAAYIFPSLSEGFGLPALEAMRYGAPVVSSNATCLPEVYGDAAHYFDPLSVDDMARAISEVITDEKLRENLIKRGSKQVETYSWERMARQTLAVYEQSLEA